MVSLFQRGGRTFSSQHRKAERGNSVSLAAWSSDFWWLKALTFNISFGKTNQEEALKYLAYFPLNKCSFIVFPSGVCESLVYKKCNVCVTLYYSL